ncbi:MAG: hypothetical protein II775_08015, partial [Prevotella sp.]|nr:hypothetical protein [Prevotella sp.]
VQGECRVKVFLCYAEPKPTLASQLGCDAKVRNFQMQNNTFPQLFSINLKNFCEARQRVGASPRLFKNRMRGTQYYILYIIIIYYNI